MLQNFKTNIYIKRKEEILTEFLLYLCFQLFLTVGQPLLFWGSSAYGFERFADYDH